jgi:sec-independent protein translocase protein TatA
MNTTLGFVLSEWQILILVLIGILLFGRKLPEIGRSLGKGIVEFKKGLKGIEEDVHEGGSASAPSPPASQPALDQPRPPQRVTSSTPKFEEAPKFEEPAPKVEDKPANAPAPPQA